MYSYVDQCTKHEEEKNQYYKRLLTYITFKISECQKSVAKILERKENYAKQKTSLETTLEKLNTTLEKAQNDLKLLQKENNDIKHKVKALTKEKTRLTVRKT